MKNRERKYAPPVSFFMIFFQDTTYTLKLFQQRAIFKILADKNATSFYSYLQNIVPCPDLFMPTKILLHKASAWGHEREWRLTCNCNSSDFNQQEFSWAKKKPTAVYLGRKISPIYEKILRHIALVLTGSFYKKGIDFLLNMNCILCSHHCGSHKTTQIHTPNRHNSPTLLRILLLLKNWQI